ncbi:MAG: AAA-like domain-containing protein [Cyanobacteriota bacterium]|nr:AAA-like domain-containing protein [Cyanobacteriota bacterium]
MNVDEALELVDQVLPKRLNYTQQLVFCQSWEKQTYQNIAFDSGYDPDYIKEVGSDLWRSLSDVVGEKVTKKNIHSVLRNYQHIKPEQSQPSEKFKKPAILNAQLEFPNGAVSLNSSFYIERPPIEEHSFAQIIQPGSLIRIRAPRQMGKTSLMFRMIEQAQNQGFHTITVNLQKAEYNVFTSLDKFLRWFCATVTRRLKLPLELDEYWDEDIGSKVSATLYFENYLLEEIENPIILAIDELDQIFEYPEIYRDFLPLLRTWYEDAKEQEIWQKLRLVVVMATESYVDLPISQSPFNVGLPIKLPEFTSEQVQDLAQRHGLNWTDETETEKLIAIVAGHPYLIRLALYHLAVEKVELEIFLQEALTLDGVYSDYLRSHLTTLNKNTELIPPLKEVVLSKNGIQLDAVTAYKLESMGLVKLDGNLAKPSCELYRHYFASQLTIE